MHCSESHEADAQVHPTLLSRPIQRLHHDHCITGARDTFFANCGYSNILVDNVAETHCYALQCRQIDCEQLHGGINQQLIAGRFGYEGIHQLHIKLKDLTGLLVHSERGLTPYFSGLYTAGQNILQSVVD